MEPDELFAKKGSEGKAPGDRYIPDFSLVAGDNMPNTCETAWAEPLYTAQSISYHQAFETRYFVLPLA